MNMIFGQFCDAYEPIVDGVTNVITNYAYWLNKKYGKCYVAAPDYPSHNTSHNTLKDFEVLRFFSVAFPFRPPYRAGLPMLDYNFYNKIRKIEFDLIHAHSPFTTGIKALQIARKKNIPIVATFHSKYQDDFRQVFKNEGITRVLTKKIVEIYSAMDHVWAPNKLSGETLKQYGFKGEIEVVQNGTDFEAIKASEEKLEEINIRFKIEKNQRVFTFIGQHTLQKNVLMLINSLSVLKKMGVKFKAIFIGKGYAEDDMKKLVEELNLTNEVIFLGIVTDRELIKVVLSRADLMLFPSVYDTSGIVIIEAAAMSCPSVLIEKSNVTEGIVDGYNGFLSQNDPVKYAGKIKAVLDDQELLKCVGICAQSTIYRKWESIIDEVYQRYCDIIKSYKGFKPRIYSFPGLDFLNEKSQAEK